MAPELFIYGAILVAVPALVGGIVLLAFGGKIQSHVRATQRLARLERSRARPEAVEALRKEAVQRAEGGPALPLLPALRIKLTRAAVSLSPAQAVGLMAALGAAAFVGMTLATEAELALRAAFSAAFGPAAVLIWLGRRAKARLAAVEDALPDAVELMVRSLRVGHPLSSAIQIVAREVPGPFGQEMAIVADETAYGRNVAEALVEMAERVGLQDLRFLAVAVTIQQQSGGNLAEVLEGLAKVIRSRFRLFRRVKAITAEAKWSGTFLSGFPLVATVGINLVKPDYFDKVRETSVFLPAAAVVGALLVANLVVMRRLVDIKV